MKQTTLFIVIAIIILVILFWFLKGKSKKENKDKKNDFSNLVQIPGYNLKLPTQTYILPNKLTEISGLSYYNDSELYCVNDEHGKIFVYNLDERDIRKTIEFGSDGDYEGIEVVGEMAYVMNSEGRIKEINLSIEESSIIDCTRPEVAEYEGITYDVSNNSLLLAAKEMQGNKIIYAYSFIEKTLAPKYVISENDIEKNEFGKNFKPSGIAVHPISNEVFIIASSGKKLIILSPDGEIINQCSLDSELFKQPEGICFAPNGDMYVSSEGKGGNGYILKFVSQNNVK
jgi:uncharacterized protein YjiK